MLKYLLLIVLFPVVVFSQELSSEMQELLNVPVLLNPSQAKKIEPNQQFCFDKKIYIKTNGGSRASEMYLYINTKDGYFATRTGRLGTLGNGNSFDTNSKRFTLDIHSKKGQHYTYSVSESNGQVKHRVNTGLTDAFAMMDNTISEEKIYKKSEQATLCDGMKTRVYKADGAAVSLYVYGGDVPDAILVKDVLMYSGLGYFVSAEHKIFAVVKMSVGNSGFEAKSWENTSICFNANTFTKAEEDSFNKMESGTQKEIEKINTKTYTGDCVEAKQAVDEKKKKLLEERTRNIQKAQTSGNLYDKNGDAMRIMANLMDYAGELEVSVLQIDVDICKAEDAKQKASDKGDEKTAERAAEKIMCLQQKKSKLNIGISQMQGLDSQYRNNPAKASEEKKKLYMQLMKDVSAIKYP